MKQLNFGLTLLFALLLSACSDSGQTPDEQTGNGETTEPETEAVTWRFALEEVEGSVQDAYAQEFKRRIEERSDGTINIEIYPYGALGTSSQLTEMAQGGNIELAFASPGHLADLIPEVGVFTLHFVLSEHNEVNREVLSDDAVYSLFQPLYNDEDLQLLDIIPEGWMVWSADKPLRTLDDFEDFRIRTMTSPILVESYRAYGANPTPMPYSEVYSGLQLGQIDGQVNPIFAIEEMSFYEEQDVLTSGRHAQFISTLAASKQWFDSLSDEQRKMVIKVRDELVDWIDKEQIQFNEERLQTILDEGGTEWVELTSEEREVFREASLGVRDTYIERAGETGEEILNTLLERIKQAEAEMEGSGEAEEDAAPEAETESEMDSEGEG
ncbi:MULTISPECIES: TRAP transporter substrate-binding protein DctP [unclassified Wenzhouxiangella]|uniref:TRAP transporter substrate-binding protein n=1 Tax=unclassified Wenzhouxiangella TaxID=2613841 RepID=UPI000E327983|nr:MULTISPECIES: TRAP transporter substrate-binding protein DctP [unclassified Wenzhouxiangella]RFF28815.1 C4-dicarboxylate ABC transporter [Wenzhouxiangella sp. 15181]RFP68208.1 C4-dicarboxylate ABC transporter [Wenzhouxiangella sp. 15190]